MDDFSAAVGERRALLRRNWLNLQVVYCTHETSPLAIRERIAFTGDEVIERADRLLRQSFPATECVVLSTCNRVEIYAAQGPADEPLDPAKLVQFLAEFHQVPLEDLAGEVRVQAGTEAVRHLFEVVSSLDSMVLGEPQIVNQVKAAYSVAQASGSCGSVLHALFQAAIHASGRVRSETQLCEGRVSIASVAVGDFARSIFDHFRDKLVLVIGAGEMAQEALRYLKDDGVGRIVVTNRNIGRAESLAAEFLGTPAPWEQLDHWMGLADVIISTTGADEPIVDAKRFAAARKESHPVFILDLGAPRDFAHEVGELDEVFLYDIDSLSRTCDENRQRRTREVERARKIIEEEVRTFVAEKNRRSSSDVVMQLRQGWHDVSRGELERLFNKLPQLEASQRDLIEETVGRIVNKLLHPPLETLKDESKDGPPHGLIDALRRLFRLGGTDG